MDQSLHGMKILILVSNGVDEGSMSNIQRELLKTGASIKTVGIESGLVNSWNNNAWGLYFPVDHGAPQAIPRQAKLLRANHPMPTAHS